MQNTSQLRQVDYHTYYSCKSLTERLQFLIHFAEHAPSRLNTRPWRFETSHDQIRIYSDFSHRLDIIDPFNRELYISIGSVIANIEIAAEFFDLYYSTCIFTGEPAQSLLAVITFDQYHAPKEVYPPSLFHSILRRHVGRNEFSHASPTMDDIDSLYDSIEWIDDVSLYLDNSDSIKNYLATLTYESELEQFSNKEFRKEFALWVGEHKDSLGLPISSLQLPLTAALIMKLLPHYNYGPTKAMHDRELLLNAPLVGILLTREDGFIDWISCGIAFQILSLRAVSLGIAFQPITSAIEITYYRDKIRDVIESTKTPQMLIRFGYERSTPPSTII